METPQDQQACCVYAQTTCGNSTYSGITLSACADGIGINNESTENSFSIYPNPTSNAFTINKTGFAEGQQLTLEMYNVIGERVFQYSIIDSKSTIKISQLKTGIYFIRLIDGDSNVVYTQRVVKE